MARKKKTFRAYKEVKAVAREIIGTPPPTRRVPDVKKKAERNQQKHKPTLEKLLTEES